jgi:hypothetical protein
MQLEGVRVWREMGFAPRQRNASSSANRRQEGQTRDIDKVFPIVSNKGQAMPKRTSCNPGILGRNGLAYPLSFSANLCPAQCGCVIPGQHHVFLDRSVSILAVRPLLCKSNRP